MQDATPNRPLSPILRLNVDLPDGRSYQKVLPFPAKEWSAAGDRADVRLGANRFAGDLHEYRKPVASVTRYVYEHDDAKIVVSFTRERDLTRARMADALTRPKPLAAKLVRFDGAYLRFAGPMTIARFNTGSQTEQYTEAAIRELMCFSHSRRPTAD